VTVADSAGHRPVYEPADHGRGRQPQANVQLAAQYDSEDGSGDGCSRRREEGGAGDTPFPGSFENHINLLSLGSEVIRVQ
jgi:hypothetical protein